MTDQDFMRLAIAEAKTAKSAGDLPFGSVVVFNGEVVGKGRAENNTKGDVTDHAELLAIREACRNLKTNDLKDCIIYCTNQPCNMCAAGIFQANIPKVVMALTREDLPWLLRPRKIGIKDLAADSSYPIEIEKGLLKEETLELFESLKK